MNAAENPFAPSRLERVLEFDPSLVGTSWKQLEARWDSMGRHVQVLGPHGAGKSCFLRTIASRFEDRFPSIHLHFNRRRRRLDDSDRQALARSSGHLLIMDGEELLPWRERRLIDQARKRALGSLTARHRRSRLPVLLRLKPDLQLAAELLRRAAPAWESQLSPGLPARFRQHQGNLRELWLECFDILAFEENRSQL